MKTQNKLIISVGSIIFISSIILVTVMFFLASSMLKESSESDISGRVSSLKTTVSSWIDSRTQDVSTWCDLKAVRAFIADQESETLLKEANAQLKAICDKYDVYQSVNILNTSGDIIASSVDGKDSNARSKNNKPPFNLSERTYFKKAMQKKQFVSDALMSKVTNSPVVCISAPVISDGEVVGALYAVVDMGLFSDIFINSVSFGKTGYAYVMDSTGLLISHPDKEQILSLNIAENFSFGKEMLKEQKGVKEYKWNDNMKTAAFDIVPQTGWILVGTKNLSEIMKPVHHLRAIGFVLSIAAVIIAISFLYLIVTKIIRGMLKEMLEEMNEIANHVTNEAEQVSESSLYIADGAKKSASSIEEISSSMTEIGSQIKLNADNAERASSLASFARDSAHTGHADMSAMLEAMNDISESSNKIANIIKVIDEIAFQTNLLALNAAVEAARAGEHGKGFAVVADEVRNLASRSASAANETTTLIEDAITNVKNGTGMAHKTGESLQAIVQHVNEVSELITDIAQASKEQSYGVAQVSSGLDQIDQVTQGNTSTADQSAAASNQLLIHARKLSETIMSY